MKVKVEKKKLILSIVKSISITAICIYAAVTYYTVANRQVTSMADTAWLSNQQDEIIFLDASKGVWIQEEASTDFTYEAKNGYVLCHADDQLLLELVEIEDNRLFAVNINNMYYNEAFL